MNTIIETCPSLLVNFSNMINPATAMIPHLFTLGFVTLNVAKISLGIHRGDSCAPYSTDCVDASDGATYCDSSYYGSTCIYPWCGWKCNIDGVDRDDICRGGYCKKCINGACRGSCGYTCNIDGVDLDDICSVNIDGCTKCLNGVCSTSDILHHTCGSSCTSSSDCSSADACSECGSDNKCTSITAETLVPARLLPSWGVALIVIALLCLIFSAIGVITYRLRKIRKAREQANPTPATGLMPPEPTQITAFSLEQHNTRQEVPSPYVAIAMPIPDAMVSSEVPESKESVASP